LSLGSALLNTVHHNAVFKRRVRVLADLIAAKLQPYDTVLDVGCGDGSVARAIMDRLASVEITGLDILQRPQTHIPVRIFDGRHIPMPDKSVDWVTLVDVLHHDADPGALLAETARVARSGIILKDHVREGLTSYVTLRFMDWVGNRGHGVRLVYNYQTRQQWSELFRAAGLELVQWQDNLALYPQPFNTLFDRKLHCLATLRPATRPADHAASIPASR
jgi:SAM-dependent methyltransferase